jgi:hypothetical protein
MRILLTLTLFFILFGCGSDSSSDSSSKSYASSLVGYDWVYPDYNNAVGAWKFSSDKTFNYSTTLFGGGTRRGTWTELGNGSFQLNYDNGDIVEIYVSGGTFNIGNTTYYRY